MAEPTLFADPRVGEILGHGLARNIERVFEQIRIAEEEIAEARGGNTTPDRADPLWCAFELLRPEAEMAEFVYRAHCREILKRIRDGEDTRPATDGEIAVAISEISLRHPLHGAVVALQMRIFERAFPDQYASLDYDRGSHERVYGREADEWDGRFRRQLRQDWRRLVRKEGP